MVNEVSKANYQCSLVMTVVYPKSIMQESVHSYMSQFCIGTSFKLVQLPDYKLEYDLPFCNLPSFQTCYYNSLILPSDHLETQIDCELLTSVLLYEEEDNVIKVEQHYFTKKRGVKLNSFQLASIHHWVPSLVTIATHSDAGFYVKLDYTQGGCRQQFYTGF
jgi:hypothetical protein